MQKMQIVDMTGACKHMLHSFFPEFIPVSGLVSMLGCIKDHQCIALLPIAKMDDQTSDYYCFGLSDTNGSCNIQPLLLIQILEAFKKYASLHGIRRLLKIKPIHESLVDSYLSAGAEIGRWSAFFDLDLAQVLDHVSKMTRPIPSDIELRKYHDNISSIDALCLESFGVLTTGHNQSTGNLPTRLDTSSSLAYYKKSQAIAGFSALIDHDKAYAYFDPLVVKHEYRNSSVFNELIKHVTQALINKNIKTGQAPILEDNKAMMRFVKRVGGKLTHREATMYLVMQ